MAGQVFEQSCLAQAGLIGEEERPVAVCGGGHDLGLVVHELQAANAVGHLRGLGQRHTGAVSPGLEGPEQGGEQLPTAEPVGGRSRRRNGREVRRQEWIG